MFYFITKDQLVSHFSNTLGPRLGKAFDPKKWTVRGTQTDSSVGLAAERTDGSFFMIKFPLDGGVDQDSVSGEAWNFGNLDITIEAMVPTVGIGGTPRMGRETVARYRTYALGSYVYLKLNSASEMDEHVIDELNKATSSQIYKMKLAARNQASSIRKQVKHATDSGFDTGFIDASLERYMGKMKHEQMCLSLIKGIKFS